MRNAVLLACAALVAFGVFLIWIPAGFVVTGLLGGALVLLSD